MRPLWSHLDELTAEHVDVDIRRSENDVLDLGRYRFFPHGDAAQRLCRKPASHGMRENGHVFDVRTFRDLDESCLPGPDANSWRFPCHKGSRRCGLATAR